MGLLDLFSISKEKELEKRIKRLEDDIKIMCCVIDVYIETAEKSSGKLCELKPMLESVMLTLRIAIGATDE